MALIREFTPEERAALDEWVASRPPAIQSLARRFPPNRLYLLRGGMRVTIYSLHEDGTLTVNVTGEFNRVLFSRKVFGVRPEDLEECDLPAPGEDLGDAAAEAGYTDEDIRDILLPRIKEDLRRESEGRR